MKLDIVPIAELNTRYRYEVNGWADAMLTVHEFARTHHQTHFVVCVDGERLAIEWLDAPTTQVIG